MSSLTANPRPVRKRGPSTRRKIVFAAVATVLTFAGLEGILRLTGIGQPPVVGTLRFGYDTGIPVFDSDGIEAEGEIAGDVPLFEADPVLFWKPIAGTRFTGADGLRRPVPAARAKAEKTYRVAVVGDSCSFLGRKTYPERLAESLQARWNVEVEIVNASCPGYASFQGVRRLDDVWPWKPDLLLVYFGGNDHWNSLNGCTDSALAAGNRFESAQASLRHLHTYWLLRQLVARRTDPEKQPVRTVRVPLEEYRANLEAIAARAAAHRCRVLFVTAPTAFSDQGPPPWADRLFGQFYRMTSAEVQAIPSVHAEYNEVVREVAAAREALLLDLARSWPPEESSSRFRADCIHLSEAGHQEVADALAGLCPPPGS